MAKVPAAVVPRARTLSETRGFLEAVVDARSDQILVFAMLAGEAGEVTAVVQTAMLGRFPLTALRDGVIAHPTMAERLNYLFRATFESGRRRERAPLAGARHTGSMDRHEPTSDRGGFIVRHLAKQSAGTVPPPLQPRRAAPTPRGAGPARRMPVMSDVIDDLAARFRAACGETGETEERVIERLTRRLHVSRAPGRASDAGRTVGQRLADRIAAFGGSWTFILLFLAALAAWVALNTLALPRAGRPPFDAYPFVFLNLVLSMLAALQAPVIMMSQNRQAATDRAAAAHDYEVNLKAELEILALHGKVDALRERQWSELVAMQRQQIELLTRLLAAGR